MKILAHGHYSASVTDSVPPLKTLVKETTGDAVRRVGRFIQLALIGAGRCLQQQTPSPDTGIYLTSGRGDLEITLDVLVQMVEHGLPPKPLSFINTVSNSACFYIAKQFGLHGRNQFVTRRHAPLESALQLAVLDLHGSILQNTALVGSVDICTEPLHDHRQRLGVSTDTLTGEGSHWFLLARRDAPDDALACIDHIVTLADRSALAHWLTQHNARPQQTALACGQHMDDTTAQWLQAQMPGSLPFCVQDMPWYDSHCGNTLGAFLQQKPAPTLLHVDCDNDGRFNVLQVSL